MIQRDRRVSGRRARARSAPSGRGGPGRRSSSAPSLRRVARRGGRQPHLEGRARPSSLVDVDLAAVVLATRAARSRARARCRRSRASGLGRPGRSARRCAGDRAAGSRCPCRARERATMPVSAATSTSTVAARLRVADRVVDQVADAAGRGRGRSPRTARHAVGRPASSATRAARGHASSGARPPRPRSRSSADALVALAAGLQPRQIEEVGHDPRRGGSASRSSCSVNRRAAGGSSIAPSRSVSAVARIDATGVFSSCEAFATKSRRIASSCVASVTSRTTSRTAVAPTGTRWPAAIESATPSPPRAAVAPGGASSADGIAELDRQSASAVAGTVAEVARRAPRSRRRRRPSRSDEQHALLHRVEDQALDLGRRAASDDALRRAQLIGRLVDARAALDRAAGAIDARTTTRPRSPPRRRARGRRAAPCPSAASLRAAFRPVHRPFTDRSVLRRPGAGPTACRAVGAACSSTFMSSPRSAKPAWLRLPRSGTVPMGGTR